ncbi:MAG: TRAP transporter large permease subunit [Dehalococcoidales bacterium]|nr:TRAP transporter large permease subunit [Dehalococcoidales bacterium]MDP6577317.1 TRAP transporter large permease subunit [Dehalococcoidales bacterium]MDP6825025.1 TRAP transporter large permease subunit [Dehalococcoidales bacterium]
MFGAMVFGYFMTISRVPDGVAYFLAGLDVNRYIIIAGIILMYLILGCFLDGLAIILLTVPVLLPVMLQLGWSPIWFGIIIIRVLEMGLITPPYGLNVFIIAGVVKDVPIGTIFRGIVPFLIADIFHVALLIAVPQLSLFLPGIMK